MTQLEGAVLQGTHERRPAGGLSNLHFEEDPGRSPRRLPAELDSLVHHLELNRSGWWDQALKTLVLATAWLNSPKTVDELISTLSEGLDGRLTPDRAEHVIEAALADGSLIDGANGKVKVSEVLAESFKQQLASVHDCETRLHERFIEIVANAGIDADPEHIWEDMLELYLRPLVREAGARMYRVITATADLEEAVASYNALVAPICEKYGHEIRPLLIEFLDPGEPDVRQFVLRMINANFVREASALDDTVLDSLSSSTNRPQAVRIYLDTNFLFSFLQLHDNPANAVAEDLVRLVEQCRARIDIDLYVLPITIEEARRVLRSVTSRLESVVPTRNMAYAAREFTSTGLVAKYLEAASQTTERLRPADFFGPYDSGLLNILVERGVKLHNDKLDALRVDQDVIDDMHLLEERQQGRPKGPKPYESNLHDSVIWNFCRLRRPGYAESPLELGAWVCTLDYGLIAFDRLKLSQRSTPPVCLTPGALVQLLQFWVPRSEEFDRVLVGSFRQPLLFLDFDSTSEQTTIDILRTLSRYENVDDLPVKTLFGVVSNDALRTRLETAPDVSTEEEIELVEAAIIEQARILDEQRQEAELEAQEAIAAANRSTERHTEEIGHLRAEVERTEQEAEAARVSARALEGRLDSKTEEVDTLRTATAADTEMLENRIQVLEQDATMSKEVTRFAVVMISLALCLGAATVAFESAVDQRIADWLAWSGPAVASVCLLVLAADRLTSRNTQFGVNQRGLVKSCAKVAAWVLLAVLGGVLANFVYDGLRGEGQGDASALEPLTTLGPYLPR